MSMNLSRKVVVFCLFNFFGLIRHIPDFCPMTHCFLRQPGTLWNSRFHKQHVHNFLFHLLDNFFFIRYGGLTLSYCTGRIPFAFLEDIHGRFVKTYGRACHTALAYAMNEEFSRVLSQQMDYYSNDPNADRMNRIKGEMSQVEFTCCLLFCNRFPIFSCQSLCDHCSHKKKKSIYNHTQW